MPDLTAVPDVKALRRAQSEQRAALTKSRTDLKAIRAAQLARADANPTEAETAQIAQLKARIDAQAELLAATADEVAEAAAYFAAEKDRPVLQSMRESIKDKPWGSLGEQLQAIAHASMPNGHRDPRLKAGPTGAGTGVPSDAGFLVETDRSNALLDAAMKEAVIAPLCTELPIGPNSDGVVLPYIDETSRANGSRFGGVQVYWRGEADTVAATKPKVGMHELRLQDLMGVAYMDDRVLADATAMQSIFQTAFASEFAFKIDDAILHADGVGKLLGVLNAANTALIVQAKETGQAADSVASKNLSRMWTRLSSRAKARAVWYINSDVTPELDELLIPAGTGAVNPRIVSYSEMGAMRIKGRPVEEIEYAPTLGDQSDISLLDMSEYLLITKGGLTADSSMHVRFLYGEMTFRWTYRINGMPKWRSAITPFKGSATRSPYVTLAERAA